LAGPAQPFKAPPHPAGAPSGTPFTNSVPTLSRDERKDWIYAQFISDNVPDWLRTLQPISVSVAGQTTTYHVIPDYRAIGTDGDYFLELTAPLLAQRLGDRLGYPLPTCKMGKQIGTNTAVKPAPAPLAPSAETITVPVCAQHNAMVRAQRDAVTNSQPRGVLVRGDKKDVVRETLIKKISPSKPPSVISPQWHLI